MRIMWLIKMLSKMKSIDMTDVMNQQAGDELLRLLKEVLM